jgi:hypothetical protein
VIPTGQLANPVVKAMVEAINAGDRDAFFALLTADATMSDDGSERDLTEWVDREIFSSEGRMEVESESDDGLSLIATFANAKYGAMRVYWNVILDGERISRFETGQAPSPPAS